MDKFAFMMHPLDLRDIYRKFKFLEKFPTSMIEKVFKLMPPMKVSDITGIESIANKKAEGIFIACPLTSKQMMKLPQDYVMNKIIKTGKLAEKKGAKILGLGAFTSVVGDAGITVAKNLNIPVTSGNSYTVATALEGAKKAAALMGIDYRKAEVLVIGASGSIGKVCAQSLSREAKFLTIAGREESKLRKLAEDIMDKNGLAVRTTSNISSAVKKADVIITVTSSVDTVIDIMDLKPGAVVCDVSRPRDISKEVMEKRDDVLVIEGGVVDVPGNVNFNFDFGFPPKKAYACMAETMILTLEGRFESFSIGRDMKLEQIDEIARLAKKHGFKLSGFRSFEKEISNKKIKEIKSKSERIKVS